MSDDFPGYLGFTSEGVIAIHADWPAYPREHGWDQALMTLGNFPVGTEFRCDDNIDRCALFQVSRFPEGAIVNRQAEFYVAVWHKDLVELDKMGLIRGIDYDDTVDNESDRRLRKLQMRLGPETAAIIAGGGVTGVFIDGEFRKLNLDSILDDEDEDEFGFLPSSRVEHLYLPYGSEISLTRPAEQRLQSLARSQMRTASKYSGEDLAPISRRVFRHSYPRFRGSY